MERIKLNDIIEWFNNDNRKPLVVWGARQVGKTYLIKELFAKKYTKKYIYYDFKVNDKAREFFDSTCDPKKYIQYMEINENIKIDSDTLIIFDEIQNCLNAFSSLKYFKQDYPEIPVIATGSMVRLSIGYAQKKDKDFLFPVGAFSSINIYPLSFEEYLLNVNKTFLKRIEDAYKNKKSLDDIEHKKALDYLHEYLSVGGMPEVLNDFIENKSYANVNRILKETYDNYTGDMSSYNVSSETIVKTRKIYANIFSQLNKSNKNFKIRDIESGKSNRDYKNAYYWLELANIIYRNKCKTGKVNYPLIEDEEGLFRYYLLDNGLFLIQSGYNQTNFFIEDKRNLLSGVFYENYVACELVRHNIPLFYWCGKNEHEFEFIVNYDGKIIPIDVKKNKGKLNSLEDYRMHNGNTNAIKISSNNYGYDAENKILTIPLYMTFLLVRDLEKQTTNIFE